MCLSARHVRVCEQATRWWLLTGGHWASLSAATSWTFRCLLCDFPLDLTNLCRTWSDTRAKKQQQEVSLSQRQLREKRLELGKNSPTLSTDTLMHYWWTLTVWLPKSMPVKYLNNEVHSLIASVPSPLASWEWSAADRLVHAVALWCRGTVPVPFDSHLTANGAHASVTGVGLFFVFFVFCFYIPLA